MKYTVEIEINKNRDEVVKLFDNVDNMYKWMKGLQRFEHMSGEPGQAGAKSKLYFKMGNRELEMIETIHENKLPDIMTGSYEAKGVYNIIRNRFVEKDENTTLYIAEQEFQFKGFMKIMAFFMPGAFKKQSMQYLRDFKEFVESA